MPIFGIVGPITHQVVQTTYQTLRAVLSARPGKKKHSMLNLLSLPWKRVGPSF